MRRLLIPLALLVAAATACTAGFDSGGASQRAGSVLSQTTSPAPLPAGREPVIRVVRRVLPSVVNVTSDLLQNSQRGKGVGTGFVVRSDGVVVTNCHVVEGATKVSVFTSDEDPKEYDARVIGGDCLHDLAVLKIDATGLPTVQLGDSGALQLGQSVVAVGYALALEGGPTVTTGIVSSLDRTIQVQDPGCAACQGGVRTYTDVIQTDAAINHGNSGGPLVDMQGRVVGINSAGDDQAENIGFAIAIDSAKDTIAEAEADPLAPSAYLGVSTQSVTADLAAQLELTVDTGAYVVAATTDGPAASAGIVDGDVVVALDGRQVGSSEDLGKILDGLAPGASVPVDVVGKNGIRRTIQVTLGSRPLPVTLP